MGVTSLVLGILGLILSFVPCIGAYGLLFTIPGIVFGGIGIAKAAKAKKGKGLSISGLVLSIIGTIIAIWWCACLGAAASSSDDISEALEKSKNEMSESFSSAAKDLEKAGQDLSRELDQASKDLDAIQF